MLLRHVYFVLLHSLTSYVFYIQCAFFREEREEGAVYEVSLKKVRYRRSGNYSEDIEEPVSHLQWQTILVRKIKAGTLKKLVDNLVSEKESLAEDMDPGYLMAFLSTYRAFAEVHDVLELLIERSVFKIKSIFHKKMSYVDKKSYYDGKYSRYHEMSW